MAVGDRSFDAGYYDAAIEAYQKARAVDSDKAWYAMGCPYRAMGNPYESVEEWGEAKSILNAKNLKLIPTMHYHEQSGEI